MDDIKNQFEESRNRHLAKLMDISKQTRARQKFVLIQGGKVSVTPREVLSSMVSHGIDEKQRQDRLKLLLIATK